MLLHVDVVTMVYVIYDVRESPLGFLVVCRIGKSWREGLFVIVQFKFYLATRKSWIWIEVEQLNRSKYLVKSHYLAMPCFNSPFPFDLPPRGSRSCYIVTLLPYNEI